jgi:cytochrome b subunit of formate dehydrogenase/mono/diheme cytochrome c family protein
MSNDASFKRFGILERVEHWTLFASFTTLGITGLVQKYATVGIAQAIMAILGGIESVRIIHRVAATVMMFETVYHVGIVGYKVFVRRDRMTMLPTLNDARAAIQALLYNLGFTKSKPQQGRYTFDEKAEYWALVWGTVVMGITGFMMWNPIATTRFLPGIFVPAAKAAHSGEALLAVLAIIVWHMYHVHLRHFNKSMFTGKLSEDEMLEEHPLELADLKAGIKRSDDPAILSRRKRVFFPVFGVAAILMLIGIYAFVTIEDTAITTLPPAQQVQIFAPLTPTPLPTALPTAPASAAILVAATWDDGISELIQSRCGACHTGAGAFGGLDLSTYSAALEGGANGSGFVPGDADTSTVIIRQSTGDHPGQFSGEELAAIRQWIEDNSPEK